MIPSGILLLIGAGLAHFVWVPVHEALAARSRRRTGARAFHER